MVREPERVPRRLRASLPWATVGLVGLAVAAGICAVTGLESLAVAAGAMAVCGLVQRSGALVLRRLSAGAWQRFYVGLLWCVLGRMALSLLLVIGYLLLGGPRGVLFALVFAASYVILGALEAWALVVATSEARRMAS